MPGYAKIYCKTSQLIDISASGFKGKGHTSFSVYISLPSKIDSLNETFGDFSSYCSVYVKYSEFKIQNHCLVNMTGVSIGIEAAYAKVNASECLIMNVKIWFCIQLIQASLTLRVD